MTFFSKISLLIATGLLAACNGGSSSAPLPEENQVPIANAGSDLEVIENQLVTLDGSKSSDPDNDSINFRWVQLSGPYVELSSEIDDTPSFIAPSGDTTLRYQLTITDGKTNSLPDTIIVQVKASSTGSDDGGQDNGGDDGSNSDNQDNSNNGNGGNSGSETPPTDDNQQDNQDDAGQDDNSNSDTGDDNSNDSGNSDDTPPTQENQIPLANAGGDIDADGLSLVTLDGSSSNDPEGENLSYTWTQISGTQVTLNSNTIEFPSFTTPNIDDTLVFGLIVNDGELNSVQDSVTINITALTIDEAPTARAGNNQSVRSNDLVTLNGDSSSDPEGNSLTYSWTQTQGTNVQLSNANSSSPTFLAPESTETLRFSLIVSDGTLNSEADEVEIVVSGVNDQLFANAGEDQQSKSGEIVILDGSESYAQSGANGSLSYQWRQTGGPAVILSSLSASTPSFTAPSANTNTTLTLTFALVISDGDSNSAADFTNVVIDDSNQAPIADAGPAQTVTGETLVTLDGSLSSDPDNDPITYQWTQTLGPTITLANANTVSPSFTAPRQGGSFQFNLSVNDGELDSVSDTVVITATPVNTQPIANAGVDRYVGSSSIVALKGSRSSDDDGDPLSYQWTQTAGPTITLSDSTAINPTFEAHTDGQLVFSLIVNDGQIDSEADTVNVTVGPIPATNIKVNGTGVTWGGNFPSGNNLDCSGESIDQQDCSLGRELTHNDDSDGRAGFSFTKFDDDGVATDAGNPDWSCVQDSVTGLMWGIKSGGNGEAGDEGLNDADDTYSWYNSDASSNGGAEGFADSKGEVCFGYDSENPSTFCNTQAYVERMNAAGWCGYADWRLPTRKELLSIVDYGNAAPMLDSDYFPSSAALTWTSTPFAIGTSSAWGVNFSYGNSFSLDKRNANQVRLVRGGYE